MSTKLVNFLSIYRKNIVLFSCKNYDVCMKRLDQSRTLNLFLFSNLIFLVIGLVHIVRELLNGLSKDADSLLLGVMFLSYAVMTLQIERNYRKNEITIPSSYLFTGVLTSLFSLAISLTWFSIVPTIIFSIAFIGYLCSYISNKM